MSVANSAVMLQQKVLSTLRNVDSGAMRLESDRYVDGRWITVDHALTPRRLELLTDLTHDFLSVTNVRPKNLSQYILSRVKWRKGHTTKTPLLIDCVFSCGNKR